MQAPRKLKSANYLIKIVIVAAFGGWALRWAMNHNATISDFTTAVAMTPLWLLIGIELFDKIADKKDYDWLGFINSSKYGGSSWMWGVILGVLVFFAVLYIMTGTLALTVGERNPGVFLAAVVYSLYIIAPETGDDELLLFLWLAATVATKGAYLHQSVFALPTNFLNVGAMVLLLL
ncbi:hypothetical protein PNA2_1309 [Pyrococcus sp. NA2]|uniref:hypothetical protein n=1 Tax=Pyrococcus sp. (strain NA2) TaxID=342949 RepID=UPI000209AD6D|nr:hypothetical protein [Pyrococcus sp. NA2]AEC52224.1 hypothetical protein PNA2_1309 [Pyrococcus sp. NA2]